MAVTDDEVRQVSHLARLALDEADVPRLATDLTEILGYVDRITAAGVSTVPAARAPMPLRPDVAQPTSPAGLMAAAPAVRDGLFAVCAALSDETPGAPRDGD